MIDSLLRVGLGQGDASTQSTDQFPGLLVELVPALRHWQPGLVQEIGAVIEQIAIVIEIGGNPFATERANSRDSRWQGDRWGVCGYDEIVSHQIGDQPARNDAPKNCPIRSASSSSRSTPVRQERPPLQIAASVLAFHP